MPRGKRKITKTHNQSQKQKRREKYAKAKLKNKSDYFTEEEKTNLRDDDLHDEIPVTTTQDSNRTSSEVSDDCSIGISSIDSDETSSSESINEKQKEYFESSIKRITFKHAAIYHLVNEYKIDRNSKKDTHVIDSTIKHLNVKEARHRNSIIDIIDEIYHMKTNREIKIKNKGGRPVQIKHDFEIAKVCIMLLERGFSLKNITWDIQAYYNAKNLSVK